MGKPARARRGAKPRRDLVVTAPKTTPTDRVVRALEDMATQLERQQNARKSLMLCIYKRLKELS